ncbi:MAG TPA: type II toxin-antitoxin system RelE/ParE family toxin [Verrucomicrobiae bacterium]|jgi:plasmid stabilization system protein ParE
MKNFAKRHPLVSADLREAARWYESEVPGLGRRFNSEAISLIKRLSREALLYAARFADIRRVNLRAFPYGIFYFIHDDTVIVLGVLHGARDTEAELARRRDLYG